MRTLTLLALAAAVVSTTAAQAAVLTVDCTAGPFTTISAAVGAASNGDTIVVHPCVYNENVMVAGFDDLHIIAAKRPGGGLAGVTGANPVGVGVTLTPTVIVDGAGLGGAGFTVANSRDVTISGFWIRRCNTSGVFVSGSEMTVIANNRMERNQFAGVFDAQSRDGRYAGNFIIRNASFGMYIENSSMNTIEDNRVYSAGRNGILATGDRHDILNNEVQFAGAEGILIGSGNENRVERNTVINNNTLAIGAANIGIGGGSNLADVIGNSTAGMISNIGIATDIAENN